MTHGSLFAGVGGFDLGFERAGWKTIWQVEKEPFCQAVLKTRFPHAERFGDIVKCGRHNLAPVDVITAGVPCQDVSVAGLRAGLKGKRTGLFYHFARILRELRPTWFVFENVPGLLSSNKGRDLAEVYRVLMVECGYGVERRCLDSQFFGVAQRRVRLFIVGRFGAPCPPEILFEPTGSEGNPAPGGETGKDVAASIVGRIGKGGFTDPVNDNIIASCLDGSPCADREAEHSRLVAYGIYNEATPKIGNNIMPTIRARTAGGGSTQVFAFESRFARNGCGAPSSVVPPLKAESRRGDGCPLVAGTLRHLGSGGPDDNEAQGAHLVCSPTDSHRVRDFAGLPEGLDSARYRALGNAVTVQVAEWIAGRIIEYAK